MQLDDRGNPTPDSFDPGPQARTFLGGIGRVGQAPKPDDAFNELVAASVADFVTKMDEAHGAIAADIRDLTRRHFAD